MNGWLLFQNQNFFRGGILKDTKLVIDVPTQNERE
jgi:hypothetical protein